MSLPRMFNVLRIEDVYVCMYVQGWTLDTTESQQVGSIRIAYFVIN
jgi:hypothetical protein